MWEKLFSNASFQCIQNERKDNLCAVWCKQPLWWNYGGVFLAWVTSIWCLWREVRILELQMSYFGSMLSKSPIPWYLARNEIFLWHQWRKVSSLTIWATEIKEKYENKKVENFLIDARTSIWIQLRKEAWYHRLLILLFPIHSQLAFVPTFERCFGFVYALSPCCRNLFMCCPEVGKVCSRGLYSSILARFI